MATRSRQALRSLTPKDLSGAVVAAVDGSRASLAAVEWAAQEAVTLGRQLGLLNVIDWPYDGVGTDRAGAVALSAEVLAEAAAHARATGIAADVVTESVSGRLGPLLVDVGRHAHTLVLGRREDSGFAGMVLGSRAVAVATHAAGPVVVVPERSPQRWWTPRPVVVVGFDRSSPCTTAMAYAFDHADRHGYAVEAVVVDVADSRSADHGGEVLEEVSGSFPAVSWCLCHVAGTPAQGLTSAAGDSALLAVGCRSRSDAGSSLLDSVSRGAIFLAQCPVAVV